MTYYFILLGGNNKKVKTKTVTNVGKNMHKLESSKTAGGNGKRCCHYGKQFGLEVLQKNYP